ncbi:MAG: glycosyltransferase family 39 protein [Methanosarcinales archaeon]|nr:glycosyltransferase family 39 protein [Methanosarcinales archaeon]
MTQKNVIKMFQDHFNIISLLIIVSLGTFFRLYNLSSKSLWFDEIGQVLVASKSTINELLIEILFHLSPPLDYIILHFVLYIGKNDFIIRLPAAIFGILSIILIYWVSKTLFSEKEGLICALLLSTSPMAVWYSQEARMYSLFMFLSLLSLFFFIKALQQNKIIWWFGFIISTVLALYTHYFSFFILLNEVVFFAILIIKKRYFKEEGEISKNIKKTTGWYFFSSLIIILESFYFCLDLLFSQTDGLKKDLWYGLSANISFFKSIFSALSIYSLDVKSSLGISDITGSIIITGIYILFLILFIFGIIEFYEKDIDQTILLFLWVLLPVVVSFVVSYYRDEPITTTRNMIFILPAFLMLISKGLINISEWIDNIIETLNHNNINENNSTNYRLIICLALLIIVLIVNVVAIGHGYTIQKQDMKGISGFLSANIRSGDVIVTFRDTTDHLGYYYTGYDVDRIVLPEKIPDAEFIYYVKSNYKKVWLISSPYMGVNSEILNWLNSNYTLERGSYSSNPRMLGAIYSVDGEYAMNNYSLNESDVMDMGRMSRFTRI